MHWMLIHQSKFRSKRFLGIWTGIGLSLIGCLSGPVSQSLGEDHSGLGDQRWREYSYGISLRPPSDVRLTTATSGDRIARFVGVGYTIDVIVKKSPIDLKIQDIVRKAIMQFAGAYPSAVILNQKHLTVSDHPAGVVYFRVPDSEKGAWLLGQAFVQVDPHVFLMLELQSGDQADASLGDLFESVLASFEVQDPGELQKQRQASISHGQAWIESIDPQRWRAVIEPERWYRILEKQLDVGYMRVSQYEDTRMDYLGLRVDLQSRYVVGTVAHDMISNFFVANDGGYEEWSIRTTVRPLRDQLTLLPSGRLPLLPGSHEASWAETGVRHQDQITVSREGPSGIHEFHWQRPPVGYLSQVEVILLHQLLTPQVSPVLGFYAYNPNSRKITFRTERCVASTNGAYVVYSRPSPESSEQASCYNAMGHLVKRVLPSGQQLVPATKRELTTRWKLK